MCIEPAQEPLAVIGKGWRSVAHSKAHFKATLTTKILHAEAAKFMRDACPPQNSHRHPCSHTRPQAVTRQKHAGSGIRVRQLACRGVPCLHTQHICKLQSAETPPAVEPMPLNTGADPPAQAAHSTPWH